MKLIQPFIDSQLYFESAVHTFLAYLQRRLDASLYWFIGIEWAVLGALSAAIAIRANFDPEETGAYQVFCVMLTIFDFLAAFVWFDLARRIDHELNQWVRILRAIQKRAASFTNLELTLYGYLFWLFGITFMSAGLLKDHELLQEGFGSLMLLLIVYSLRAPHLDKHERDKVPERAGARAPAES